MCEILVFVRDKVNSSSAALDRCCYKAGDVVNIYPDGQYWSPTVLNDPNWKILKMPGVDPTSFRDMVVPDLTVEYNMLRRRKCGFDVISTIWGALAAVNTPTITLTTEQVSLLIATKKNKPAVIPTLA